MYTHTHTRTCERTLLQRTSTWAAGSSNDAPGGPLGRSRNTSRASNFSLYFNVCMYAYVCMYVYIYIYIYTTYALISLIWRRDISTPMFLGYCGLFMGCFDQLVLGYAHTI